MNRIIGIAMIAAMSLWCISASMAEINTEAGVYVESPELARQVVAYMDEGVLPENSYRVKLDDGGNLVWLTEKDGQEVRYSNEPESTFWQRFVAGFVKMLGIEDQL